jgi:hypothetical protein
MTSKERLRIKLELRRSNASSPQDSRPNRARTRATVKAAEIKESNT